MDAQAALVAELLESLGRLSSWMHATKRWRIHGELTIHQAAALDHLLREGSLRAGQLAELIQSSPAATTALLDQLQRHQLVERTSDPRDRRAVIAKPTRRAEALWPEIQGEIYAAANKTFSGWSVADLNTFRDHIERLLSDAEQPEVA